MSDRQHAAPGTEQAADPPAHGAPHTKPGKGAKDPLAAASEAAAELSAHDADADRREEATTLQAELDAAKVELADMRDKWLRLNAEFDNFRKRTARERLDLIQFAAENAWKNVLPVLDDMERAIASNASTDDIAAVREGFLLIQGKLLHILGSQGVRPMADMVGKPFDLDRQEAVTKAPAPGPDGKGRVLDVIENGYTLHDKVIRYAKVVVGD